MTGGDPDLIRRQHEPLSLSETARSLGICNETARRLVETGQIPGTVLPSGRYRIQLGDVKEYRRRSTNPDPGYHLRTDGSLRRRREQKTGRIYTGVSAWPTRDAARAAAAKIRSEGGLACVTQEIRRHGGWRRQSMRNRYIYLVWEGEDD